MAARKVELEVTARFDTTGRVEPLSFVWEDGETYEIDRVLDVRHAPALKVGGVGMRYECRIQGRLRYIFCDEGKWFMEVEKPAKIS